MTAGHISLIALLVAITLSCFSRVNVGLVAFALAWGVGLVTGGGAELVVKSFPAQLFVTLCGVTCVRAGRRERNHDGLAHAAFRLARGDARRIPPILFASPARSRASAQGCPERGAAGADGDGRGLRSASRPSSSRWR
jgi:hypothetical protein